MLFDISRQEVNHRQELHFSFPFGWQSAQRQYHLKVVTFMLSRFESRTPS